MATDAIPRPPRGLGPTGKRLWRTYAGTPAKPDAERWIFNSAELEILARAARLEDLAERIRRDLAGAPLTVRGSQGQQVPNGLINELRQTELAIHRLIQALNIPDETDGEAASTGRFTAQTGANAAAKRWAHA